MFQESDGLGDAAALTTSKAESLNAEEEEITEYKPHRVFINHVDSYHSTYISAYIADQIHGNSKIVPPGPDEGEGEEVPQVIQPPTNMPKDKYEFIGTLSSPFRVKSEDIQFTVQDTDSDQFREEIMKCGFIIFDITRYSEEIPKALKTLSIIKEEFEKIKGIGEKTFERFKEHKVFILLSTVMTWALTRPIDPEDPDLPFSEVDYKKRRPHPNYKEHYTCEKEVIKAGSIYKEKLKTYVLCSGITYGEEESDLQFFFKMAWYNETLPIFYPGTNIVPTIHVKDLAKALHGLMENVPVKPQYILAVEQSPSTLNKIIKSLSKALGENRTVLVPREEAFLYNDLTQTVFERFTINLNMEPVFLVENLQLEWRSEENLPENMMKIVEEYRRARQLRPIKIILHGPPSVGKTKLAKKLCEHYKTHYVSVRTMMEDCLKTWKDNLIRPEKPEQPEEYFGEENPEEEAEEDDPQVLMEQIRELEVMLETGADTIPDDYVIGLMKTFLARNLCQNRGYVLDEFPGTIEQAKELFGQEKDEGGEEEEADEAPADLGKILPDLVVSMEASDEYLCKSVMHLLEEEIKDTEFSELNMISRLEKFRDNNKEDNTVLNYFDELEIDILLLEVKAEGDLDRIFHEITAKCGLPVGFGLTIEEEAELYRIEQEQRRLEKEKEEINKRIMEELAEKDRKDKMEGWAETLEKLQQEEEKILIAQSEPLRHYLMKYVFPTLTKGLIELAKVKPTDPLDFLAEYLFKENPEGKMFDPSYNAEDDDLYNTFRQDIEKIISDQADGIFRL